MTQLKEFLEGVVGVVEANAYEQWSLWRQNDGFHKWVENSSGLMEIVGELAGMPVCLSLRTAEVRGRKILFFDATSRVVDHRMIDKWLEENLPKSAFRPDGQFVNKTDATNFHNVLN